MGYTNKGQALDAIKDNTVGPTPHYASYLMNLLETYPQTALDIYQSSMDHTLIKPFNSSI